MKKRMARTGPGTFGVSATARCEGAVHARRRRRPARDRRDRRSARHTRAGRRRARSRRAARTRLARRHLVRARPAPMPPHPLQAHLRRLSPLARSGSRYRPDRRLRPSCPS
ncbi:hypothetical protein FRZ00_14015 [Streptomyces mobaraensis]|uniref:Uncharacterized protein n=1 Tax=Streptomyces mobaraensis TaxID=35621 RepID=A0A5N5W8F5_STRMB|nr:hypothetical protein FRZ00_14015 [Streptomyces mobaraensis]